MYHIYYGNRGSWFVDLKLWWVNQKGPQTPWTGSFEYVFLRFKHQSFQQRRVVLSTLEFSFPFFWKASKKLAWLTPGTHVFFGWDVKLPQLSFSRMAFGMCYRRSRLWRRFWRLEKAGRAVLPHPGVILASHMGCIITYVWDFRCQLILPQVSKGCCFEVFKYTQRILKTSRKNPLVTSGICCVVCCLILCFIFCYKQKSWLGKNHQDLLMSLFFDAFRCLIPSKNQQNNTLWKVCAILF